MRLADNVFKLLETPPRFAQALQWPTEGDEKLTNIIFDFIKQLASLNRYERRALPRRMFTARELDAARKREYRN